MTKPLIAIAIGMASFTLSILGVYVTMPVLAPDVVEAARAPGDSLAVGDSLAASDSLAAGRAAGDSLQADTLAAPSDLAPLAATEDTVAVLRRRLREAEQAAADRRASVRSAEERLAALRAQRAGASELGATLAELEGDELAAILRRLDLPVLKRLYAEASGRNRKRLLKAMPAERAAFFVSQIVTADSPTASAKR